uniref:Secreted protein n=1 Tax=Molossus molossus TaxID=27622 RepID=A0A7J8I232_MOLMO|nr:hypothetical protein HJG59_010903 [Molossus molossus]
MLHFLFHCDSLRTSCLCLIVAVAHTRQEISDSAEGKGAETALPWRSLRGQRAGSPACCWVSPRARPGAESRTFPDRSPRAGSGRGAQCCRVTLLACPFAAAPRGPRARHCPHGPRVVSLWRCPSATCPFP